MGLTLYTSFHMLNPSFPFFIHSLNGSNFIAGLCTSIFSFAALLIRPIAGWILDHRSRRWITLIGMSGVLCFPLLYNFTSLIGIAVFLRMMQGFFWGITGTCNGTNAADVIPRQRFTEGMSFFGLTSNLAYAIAPALGLWLSSHYGFTPLFVTSFVLALIAWLLCFRLRFRPLPQVNKKEHFSFRRDFINRKALPPSIVMMLCSMPYGAITTFVAVYASTRGISGGIYFTVMAITTAVSRIFCGPIVDRKGAKGLIVTGFVFFFLSLGLLNQAVNNLIFAGSALFFGAGFGFLMPSLQTIALRSSPMEHRGSATSTFYISFDVGMGIGSLLAGWLSGIIGFSWMYGAMLLPLAVALTYFLLHDRREQRNSVPAES